MWLREFGLRPTVYGWIELYCLAMLFVVGGIDVEAAPPRRHARMCLLGFPYLSSGGKRLRRRPPGPADADRHGAARSRTHPTHHTRRRPAKHTTTDHHPGLTELPTWTPHNSSAPHTPHILPRTPPAHAPPQTRGAAQHRGGTLSKPQRGSGALNRHAHQFQTRLPFRSALHVARPSVYSTRARAPGSAHAAPTCTAGRD